MTNIFGAYLFYAGHLETNLAMPNVNPRYGPHPRKVKGYRIPDDPNKGVGRNQPCPCGSGKKFKKCCIKPWNR